METQEKRDTKMEAIKLIIALVHRIDKIKSNKTIPKAALKSRKLALVDDLGFLTRFCEKNELSEFTISDIIDHLKDINFKSLNL